jgi:hypothetical protein
MSNQPSTSLDVIPAQAGIALSRDNAGQMMNLSAFGAILACAGMTAVRRPISREREFERVNA